MRKEYLERRLTLLKTTPCSFLEATEKSDPSINEKTESQYSSPQGTQEKAPIITLRQRCEDTLRFNEWNEEMWSHRYMPTERNGPRSTTPFEPQAPAPYIPKPKKEYKTVQNAWQRRYKKIIDAQEEEEKRKKEQLWGDDVELFYKQYKSDAKFRFSKQSKYQNSYNGLSSMAVNRFFKLAHREETLKKEKQERPKSAQLLRADPSQKLAHDPIQLKRGLPFLEVFDIVTKSENINSFLNKKECQEFANNLTPELRDLIEQVIAERVIQEFQDQKEAIHSKRVKYLQKKLNATLSKQRIHQAKLEKEIETRKKDEYFKKFVKTLYVKLSAECRGSKPPTSFAAFEAATLPKRRAFTGINRTQQREENRVREMTKSSRTVLRQLSHMAFKREDLQSILNKGKSIYEMRSASVIDTGHLRYKSEDVPRCESCRQVFGESTITHYTGGPRKETAQQTAQERTSWVRNMAVLKIQRFFRHRLSKKKLKKIMDQNEQEKIEQQDFFERKRSKIRLMKELSSSNRILNILQQPEIQDKSTSEPPILNRYNQREKPRGYTLSSQESEKRFQVKNKLYDDRPAQEISRKDEVLRIFEKKIDVLNINLERRIDMNRFPRRIKKSGNVLMDRVARIRQRDLLKAARKNDLDYIKRLSKVIKPWDFRAEDQDGNTVLVHAAKNGSVEMLKYALQKGKHEIEVNHHNKEGFTGLHYAMMNSDHDELILILLTRGADPGAVNLKGETPLFYASEYLLHRLGMWKLPVQKGETKTSTLSLDKLTSSAFNEY